MNIRAGRIISAGTITIINYISINDDRYHLNSGTINIDSDTKSDCGQIME